MTDLRSNITAAPKPADQALSAMGLSWRQRINAGSKIDLPVIDFGAAKLVLMPAESYVEFQLYAQRLCPDSFVVTMGYGECAPGFIATDKAFAEEDNNLDLWCWVSPGCEPRLRAALEAALKPAGRQ